MIKDQKAFAGEYFQYFSNILFFSCSSDLCSKPYFLRIFLKHAYAAQTLFFLDK
jgi:hypothetical protein